LTSLPWEQATEWQELLAQQARLDLCWEPTARQEMLTVSPLPARPVWLAWRELLV
jgi:hypothetical protein